MMKIYIIDSRQVSDQIIEQLIIIFTIKTILNKYLYKNKKQVFACFVDFSKAFDSLSHEALFQKLYTLGIKGIFFQLIHNMYTHAKFVVKKDHTITDPSILGKGV